MYLIAFKNHFENVVGPSALYLAVYFLNMDKAKRNDRFVTDENVIVNNILWDH